MSLYSQTIVLNTLNPSVTANNFAPFKLTIDPSNVKLTTNNIRKIEYVWNENETEVVSYKPTLPKPIDGDPKNTKKTKEFYSNDYELSIYDIKINIYFFGITNPRVFNIKLNLQNPTLDKTNNSYFQEVHLIKTKMFGPKNTLLYVFESTSENNLLMSVVDWDKKPLPPIPEKIPLKRPYTFVDPFALKFKDYNNHIKSIPYSYDNNNTRNNPNYNPDDSIPIYNLMLIDLFESATKAIDSRIEGKDPNTAKAIFSTQDDATPTYVRNTNCWAYDLDLTCNSVWNSAVGYPSGRTGGGTLITKRHIIFAAHFPIPEGTTIRFITKDNQIVERTLLSTKIPSSYSPYYPDFGIGVLDSDVPNTITPCYLMDNSILNYLSNNIRYIPILNINQDRYATIYDGGAIQPTYTNYTEPLSDINHIIRDGFFVNARVGDSGLPDFIIVKDKLVLLSVKTFSDGSGTSLCYQIPLINQLITDVDFIVGSMTGYTTKTPDVEHLKRY